jgi:hypothetical protein
MGFSIENVIVQGYTVGISECEIQVFQGFCEKETKNMHD